MIGFEYPWLLLALAPTLPTLLLLMARSRGSVRRMLSLVGGRSSRILTGLQLLRIVAAIMLAMSAAGVYTVSIVYVDADSVPAEYLAEAKAIHVILVDDSRSMSYREGLHTRLDQAKKIVKEYLESMGPGDRVILYSFHSRVEKLCEGTPQECINALDLLTGSRRYTALGTAIGQVQAARSAGLPVVGVVVTDGGHNYGPPPESVVQGLGDTVVALVRVGSDPRGELLKDLAAHGNILYYDASRVSAEGIVEDLAKDLYRTAKVEALAGGRGTVPVATRDYTLTAVMAALAGILLALSMVAGP